MKNLSMTMASLAILSIAACSGGKTDSADIVAENVETKIVAVETQSTPEPVDHSDMNHETKSEAIVEAKDMVGEHAGMDHSNMDQKASELKAATKKVTEPIIEAPSVSHNVDHGTMEAKANTAVKAVTEPVGIAVIKEAEDVVDHSTMDHGAMDHGSMDHGTAEQIVETPIATEPAADHSDHAAMGHSSGPSSMPADGAVLSQSPAQIGVNFGHAMSIDSMVISTLTGETIPLDVSGIGTTDHIMVDAPDLQADDYVVDWRAKGADGHVMSGSFTFTVE